MTGALSPEPFCTLKEAADALGIKYFALRRAIRLGLIPYHTMPGNTRKLVLLSEVVAAIRASREGGANV